MRLSSHALWMLYLVLCVVGGLLASDRRVADRTIVAKRSALAQAERAHAELVGRPLTEAEQRDFQRGWLQDLVLLKDARRRGLDRDDVILRATVLGDITRKRAGDIPDPTPEEARTFYEARQDLYRRPDRVDLSWVALPLEDEAAEARLLERLRQGEDEPAGRLYGLSATDLRLRYGAVEAARAFAGELGTWQAPFDTPTGRWSIRLDTRHPAVMRSYEEVSHLVLQDWRREAEQRALEPHLATLRERHGIVLDEAQVRTRVAARELLEGRPLDEAEQATLRREIEDEELLLADARATGVDRSRVVSRRLLKKMRFLLRAELPVPTDAELRALYDRDPQRFVPPGRSEPLAFDRVRDQLRTTVAGPMARAALEARVRKLVSQYHVVLED